MSWMPICGGIMHSELECALLALLALRPHASGYELHSVIKQTFGYVISASFSQIYPALKRLYLDELVTYELEPIRNRPGKKRYELTERGRDELRAWLASPVDYSRSMNPLYLRIAFMSLMTKDEALCLVDSAIAKIRNELENPRFGGRDALSYAFVDEAAVDMGKLDFTWSVSANRFRRERVVLLEWLLDLREGVERVF